jgi:3-phenylpropionate/trans-cinnamate dioxygenase ferredoxin subunit
MSDFEAVAGASDLPEGTLIGVRMSSGDEVCLFNYRGSIGAVGNVCTHAEFLLSDGTLRNDGTLECAWHGARFDCRTGRVCRGPAEDPLPVYEVRIDHGRVLVRQTGSDEQAVGRSEVGLPERRSE